MPRAAPTYIWRKLATREWLERNEPLLQEMSGGSFAIIERPPRKRLLIEVASPEAKRFADIFGGRSEKLARDWLNELLRRRSAKPIRVGSRLVVTSDEKQRGPDTLIIPAGAAFGTGEHATTAMSLRMLADATRGLARGWRMLDAGTGSGILALAGKRFGGGEVIAIDNNPLAISTAKQNARLNRIRGVQFIEVDVARCISGRFDIITANLYSDLLLELLPRFARALAPNGRVILSGVMRTQERELVSALRKRSLEPASIRRRGKWIALLVRRRPRGKSRLTPRSAKRTLAVP